MEPYQLDIFIDKARALAISYKNTYLTCEHLLYILLGQNELQNALRDLQAPVAFMLNQLQHYFRDILEKLDSDCKDSELAVSTQSLNKMISQTLLQAVSSGRSFPRPIDFVIQIIDISNTFASALFKAVSLSKLDLMSWASGNPSASRAEVFKHGYSDDEDRDIGDDDKDLDDDDDDEELSDDDDDNDDEQDDMHGPESPHPAFSRIKSYVNRLVYLAKLGSIDPVIGRKNEIDTCCRALMRRTKCNVLIIGDAGVGKTAIVEGLALAIALDKVPDALRGAEIYSVDVPALMAGTKFRGEMEARLKLIINYVKRAKNAILFIDELHSATGRDNANSNQDILSLLKPELAKGSMRLIGTTTYEDYRKSLQADTALMRRFHKLNVEEPDEEMTCRILHEISEHYAFFHDVEYTSDALNSAVRLAGRFITERHFPDKAIDVIDEAGAANRMKPLSERVQVIDTAEIEEIITSIARIPDLHVSADESTLLKTAETRLKELIFGQDKAIESVVNLVKLSRAGLRAPNKPVACMLFAGPTGVGKTEVSRQLAAVLAVPFVRFDMSEYREEYTISKFIGSAPGYVGYDRGGLLTEAIRAKPNCVLLLDEIEKAHSSIYDLLLQVMDVAKLTDNTGKSADFRNVILIMTSNAGSEEMSKVRIGFGGEMDVSQGMRDIERTFSPEFRNRLDDIITFGALTQDSMAKIVTRMVNELEAQLNEKNVKINLSDDARAWLAEHGFDQKFGARPMARLIQTQISLPLANEILFGALKEGGTAVFSVKSDKSGLNLTAK